MDRKSWRTTLTNRPVMLVQVATLVPHEEHDEVWAVQLATKIMADDVWTAPIVVERRKSVIMDGHHRFRAAQILRLRTIPAVIVSYGDPGVSLFSWRIGEVWTPESLIARAGRRELLPMKSTRHVFSPPIGEVVIPLSLLARASLDHSGVSAY